MHVVPLKVTTCLGVSEAFTSHLGFKYGATRDLLPDIGPQFTTNLYHNTCHFLGIANTVSSAYHAKNKSQVEHFNHSLLPYFDSTSRTTHKTVTNAGSLLHKRTHSACTTPLALYCSTSPCIEHLRSSHCFTRTTPFRQPKCTFPASPNNSRKRSITPALPSTMRSAAISQT